MRSEVFASFFAEAVRRNRKAKGLTREELAERADLASKMISLVERCQRNPSVNVADRIARGLGVPLSRLAKEAEDARQKSKGRRGFVVVPH
jgi:transcriptional regulator with XRE-family HTH domain